MINLIYKDGYKSCQIKVEKIELYKSDGLHITFTSTTYEYIRISGTLASFYDSLRYSMPDSVFLYVLSEVEGTILDVETEKIKLWTTPNYFVKINQFLDQLFYSLRWQSNFIGAGFSSDIELTIGATGTPEEILWICKLMLEIDSLESEQKKVILVNNDETNLSDI